MARSITPNGVNYVRNVNLGSTGCREGKYYTLAVTAESSCPAVFISAEAPSGPRNGTSVENRIAGPKAGNRAARSGLDLLEDDRLGCAEIGEHLDLLFR